MCDCGCICYSPVKLAAASSAQASMPPLDCSRCKSMVRHCRSHVDGLMQPWQWSRQDKTSRQALEISAMARITHITHITHITLHPCNTHPSPMQHSPFTQARSKRKSPVARAGQSPRHPSPWSNNSPITRHPVTLSPCHPVTG